jgi:hypothetical protein
MVCFRPRCVEAARRREQQAAEGCCRSKPRQVGLALHRTRQTDAERLHRVFNGRMRDELLNESLFIDFDQARSAHRRLGHRLQHREAPLLARLQNAGRLCRYTRRALKFMAGLAGVLISSHVRAYIHLVAGLNEGLPRSKIALQS